MNRWRNENLLSIRKTSGTLHGPKAETITVGENLDLKQMIYQDNDLDDLQPFRGGSSTKSDCCRLGCSIGKHDFYRGSGGMLPGEF